MTNDKISSGNIDSFSADAERLQFAMKVAGIGIWEVEADTRIVRWDARCRELFGLASGNDLSYEQAICYIHTDDRDKVTMAVNAAMNGENNGRYDVQYRTIGADDGKLRWVRFSGQAFFDGNGNLSRFGGIAEDMTGLITTAQTATEAHSFAKVALESAGAGYFRIRLPTNEMEYSPTFARILTGSEKPGLTRAVFIQYIHPADRELRERAYRIAAETGKLNYEARAVWDDGSIHWVQTTGTYITGTDGEPQVFTGTIRDITGQVEQNRLLLAGEARFLNIVEQAPMAIGLLRGRNMVIELGNDKIFRLWGKDHSITGKPLIEALPEIKGQPFLSLLEGVYDSGVPFYGNGILAQLEHTGRLADLYFDFTYTPLRNAEGVITGIMVLATEVTAREQARKAIEESESRFRSLVENTPDLITRWDKDLRLIFTNSAFAQKTGVSINILTGLTNLEMGQPASVALPYMEALQRTFDTGKLQEHHNTLSTPQGIASYYSTLVPEKDSNGEIISVLSIARNVTELKRSEERLRAIITAAAAGIALFVGRNLVIEYCNQTFIDIVGKGPGIKGLPLQQAMPGLITEGQPFLKIMDDVFTTGKMFQSFGSQIRTVKDGVTTDKYYNITCTPVFDEEGKVYAILHIATDVTEQIKTVHELDKAGQTLELAMQIGELGNFVIDLAGSTATYSAPVMEWLGLNSQQQPLQHILARIHPDDRPKIMSITTDALSAGNGRKHDLVYRVVHAASGEIHYLHSMGQVQVRDGKPVLIAGIIQNVTAQVMATRKLEASESRLRSLVESAPFPIGVYTGREMRIRLANQTILDIWGKGNDVIGRLYSEVLPELENQEIFEQLDRVFTTGIPFHNRNQRIDIITNGTVRTYYFNYSFTPLFEAEGKVYGVMNTAADVTDLAMARQRAEKAETALYGAIALADLGTWSLEVPSGVITYSSRILEWFGFAIDETNQQMVFNQMHSKDRERVRAALVRALDPSGDGMYDEEYTVIARDTGRERILHAQGKAVFDQAGRPLRISGTIQDVTIHRQLQLALENEVQQRTEELAASNSALRTTNEELAHSNRMITRSNEELAQYAYVASHDLQEPLRKIRMFAGMLSSDKTLPVGLAPLVQKIDKSTERMVMLIGDLLEFSRLLKSDILVRPVNLAETTANVINDFELMIEEKKAIVTAGYMPQVQAVAMQMNQLFYNLLGNALKFSKPGIAPVIVISSQPVSHEEAGKHITQPFPFAQYYRITVSDNGIGFDSRYAEHIFEVFKRLHGRDLYPGSGIGLAMCRRIADNHNGRLYAESVPDEGSVFHLLLPSRQHDHEDVLPAGFKWTND